MFVLSRVRRKAWQCINLYKQQMSVRRLLRKPKISQGDVGTGISGVASLPLDLLILQRNGQLTPSSPWFIVALVTLS